MHKFRIAERSQITKSHGHIIHAKLFQNESSSYLYRGNSIGHAQILAYTSSLGLVTLTRNKSPVVSELEAFQVYYSHCYYISKFWFWKYWTDFDEIFFWYPYYTNSLDGIIFKTVATETAEIDFVWKTV